MFTNGPICQNNFISTIKYFWLDVEIIKVISKIAIFFDYIQA